MKKALITGITGFVGSHLAEFLLEKDYMVFGLKRWRSPVDNIQHILDKVDLVDGDLVDSSRMYEIVNNIKPDEIYHLAAQSYVPYSFDNPIATFESNINGTTNLLEAVRKNRSDAIVHVCSSSEVYGQVEKHEVPIKETQPFRPVSPYALSKVGTDMLADIYYRSHGVKTIRTRAFTHSGPRRGDVFVVSAFARQIAMIENRLCDPIVKVGNLDSVRTFMDVRDTIRAYWMLVQNGKIGDVYNVGGDVTMTIGDMLKKLLKLTSFLDDIKIEQDSTLLRSADVTLQIPCLDKIEKDIGWCVGIPFEKTLQDIFDYWRIKTCNK